MKEEAGAWLSCAACCSDQARLSWCDDEYIFISECLPCFFMRESTLVTRSCRDPSSLSITDFCSFSRRFASLMRLLRMLYWVREK